jgi:DNA-binding response OmpR family regulator
MRILLVEDERSAARMLAKGLREHGHAVDVAADGAAAVHHAAGVTYDVVLLDILLPIKNGLDVCRELRASGNAVPVLMLTARDAVDDRIRGLDAGADDYLTKPFSFKILLARLRALSRRKNVEPRTQLQIGDLVFDPATREVKRAGAALQFTRTELVLLDLLMRNAGRVITRTRLIEAAWGNERDVESNTLDVFIRQLRAKIDLPGRNKLIHTIRGVGYALREEDSA